ncbi:MAG: hypothetical protein V1907_03705 [Candidatus Kerfeldbacteria bacterium]
MRKYISNKRLAALSKSLMLRQTKKNRAPAWVLTEHAVIYGRKVARRYGVDADLVVASLYLAHTVFSPIWSGRVQRNHERLSSNFVVPYLRKWRVAPKDIVLLQNAIEAHHDHVRGTSKLAEVMKNAECMKFVTVEGALFYFHELGRRGWSPKLSAKRVLLKMKQKLGYLTLPDCISIAKKNRRAIEQLFVPLIK